jgi:ATP-binding cassette, subfamily F, member 3
VFRPVGQLSGGEKNRLVLAQLVLARPNLLMLDEPTNHLDLDARDALTEMLKAYDGTLLLASHDRYLLDQVTTQTMEVEDGRATLHDGPYSLYRRLKESRAAAGAAQRETAAPQRAPGNPLTTGMNSFQLSKARKKALQTVQTTERRVTEMEDWLKRIEEALSAPMPGDDIVKLAHDYERAQTEVGEALRAWEEAVAYAEGIGAAV